MNWRYWDLCCKPSGTHYQGLAATVLHNHHPGPVSNPTASKGYLGLRTSVDYTRINHQLPYYSQAQINKFRRLREIIIQRFIKYVAALSRVIVLHICKMRG
jgi:hypothetical protein